MRKIIPPSLVAGRVRHGVMASSGWEHVSVSCKNRAPNWPEMAFVKDLFWAENETVIQFHPPRSVYVNNHPHCLHLWRNTLVEVALPPSIMVGYTPTELEARGGLEAVKRKYAENARDT